MKKIILLVLLFLCMAKADRAYAYEKPVAGIAPSLDAFCEARASKNNYEEPIAGIAVSLSHYREAESKKVYDIPLSAELQKYTYLLCKDKYPDVKPELVFAVLDKESDYDFDAYHRNRNGSYDAGGMQINSRNFDWLEEELGVDDFYDPKQNILSGVYMLSIYGGSEKVHKALVSYNCGPSEIYDLWDKGLYSNAYSRDVMSIYDKLPNKKINEWGIIFW